jgi:hypothetical protein
MALLFFDGFDNYGTPSFSGHLGSFQWGADGSSSWGYSSTTRHGYGKSIQHTASGSQLHGFMGSSPATIYCGIACRGALTIAFLDSYTGSTQATLVVNGGSSYAALYRGTSGGTLLARTPNNIVNVGNWNYYEVGLTVDNSTGYMEFRLNGQSLLNLTGIDTQISANALVNYIVFSGSGNFYDDFYVNDSTAGPGSFPCDSFNGDVRVDTLFATGNNAVQWTPLSSTNVSNIDEIAADGDTTYNSSNTTGQEDTFTFGALSGTINSVIGVQVQGAYRKDDAGTRTMKQAVISGATEAYGTTWYLSGGYSYITDIFALDPGTSASWTATGVNNLKAGYKLES